MNCNCNCRHFFYVNEAQLSGNNIVLTLSKQPTLRDGNRLCFRFGKGVSIPANSSTYPVYIQINGSNYPIWNKYGDILTGAGLIESNISGIYCSKFTYHGFIGQQTTDETINYHLILHNIPREACCK